MGLTGKHFDRMVRREKDLGIAAEEKRCGYSGVGGRRKSVMYRNRVFWRRMNSQSWPMKLTQFMAFVLRRQRPIHLGG